MSSHLVPPSFALTIVPVHLPRPSSCAVICKARSTIASMNNPSTSPTQSEVTAALSSVRLRIERASSTSRKAPVQLVAVSKTKPVELLQAAYSAGQRHFGENYVQELASKYAQLPSDVKWHYIGPLQSNKAKLLLSVPNLHVVETVDREKTASALDKACITVARNEPLNVMIQVNTSGEETKSGTEPGEQTIQLAKVISELPNLNLVGLMTIGAPDASEEPIAFQTLAKERVVVAEALGLEIHDLQLSMGMSGDFETAIRMGSDSVRVGSTIFGARNYPNK